MLSTPPTANSTDESYTISGNTDVQAYIYCYGENEGTPKSEFDNSTIDDLSVSESTMKR